MLGSIDLTGLVLLLLRYMLLLKLCREAMELVCCSKRYVYSGYYNQDRGDLADKVLVGFLPNMQLRNLALDTAYFCEGLIRFP